MQDSIAVSHPGGPGEFKIPNWDKANQKRVRDALLVLATAVTDTRRVFGTKDEVNPVQYLIGAASAWGANAPRDAIYLNVVPPKSDGKTRYVLTVRDVPVYGFWSVSVYNAEGYYEKNQINAYSLNSLAVTKDEDNRVTIRFGGWGWPKVQLSAHCERLGLHSPALSPRPEILDGKWSLPIARPQS